METTENILNGLKNNEFKMYLQFIDECENFVESYNMSY